MADGSLFCARGLATDDTPRARTRRGMLVRRNRRGDSMATSAETMTKAQKVRTLLAIVECAPAACAMTVFESASRRGDLSAFWDHYQEALGRSKHDGQLRVASTGEVSLEMVAPAMQAVYDLPTRD